MYYFEMLMLAVRDSFSPRSLQNFDERHYKYSL